MANVSNCVFICVRQQERTGRRHMRLFSARVLQGKKSAALRDSIGKTISGSRCAASLFVGESVQCTHMCLFQRLCVEHCVQQSVVLCCC